MAKANNKTTATKESVEDFLQQFSTNPEFEDLLHIDSLMRNVTGAEPKLWGTSIIGYGDVELKYASGRELDWFQLGFSPRKQAISLYLTCDLSQFESHLQKLGKFKMGKGCLYIKRLNDINAEVLEALCKEAMDKM